VSNVTAYESAKGFASLMLETKVVPQSEEMELWFLSLEVMCK
jgi:hypothetical protein